MKQEPAQPDHASLDGMDAPPMTHVPAPRDRIFLPQSFNERVKVFWWSVVRLFLFRPSLQSMHGWRVVLLRLFGAKIQGPVHIDPTARIEFPWNLRLEKGVFIAHQVIINCMGEVLIGEGSLISQYSHIISGTHDYTSRDMRIERRPIRIGKEVWIAADAFVGPGVTIGDGCVLAARSSAFRNLPPGQVCMGEPARPTHARFEDAQSLQPLIA
jgi:putative colanic acid biosynthesis acetyltransferase WcaF